MLFLVCTPFAHSAASLLTPTVVWIPQEYHTGGAYTAIQAAPDGAVYLGTTFYDGFARFLLLPAGAKEFRLIADMGGTTGETTPGPYAQAKIHTKPAVAPDGKVYFGTKSGKPAIEDRWQANYPGGHLLVYDPQTRQVTDLGIPRPRQSIIAVGVDPRRNLVYVLTDPEGRLIIFDPRTRSFSDIGVFIPSYPPTRYFIVLANGDAFHPGGPDAFFRYRAATGRIERVPLQFLGQGSYVDGSTPSHGPYAMAADPDGLRFHGVGEASGQVYSFIPSDSLVQVQFRGTALPAGSAVRMSHYAMAAGPDGHTYYTATLHSGGGEGALYILRLVKTGRPEVVGQVAPLPPAPFPLTRRPGRLQVQGATAGPDGTFYVMLAYPLRILIFPRLTSP